MIQLSYEITTRGNPEGGKKKKKVLYGDIEPCHQTEILQFMDLKRSKRGC